MLVCFLGHMAVFPVLCLADKIIRVYSKNPDPDVIKALKFAFTQWSEKRHK